MVPSGDGEMCLSSKYLNSKTTGLTQNKQSVTLGLGSGETLLGSSGDDQLENEEAPVKMMRLKGR